MPRPRNTAPAYRQHAGTGQAVCTVRLPDGRRHDLYLGKFDSPTSRAEYRRVLFVPSAPHRGSPGEADFARPQPLTDTCPVCGAHVPPPRRC